MVLVKILFRKTEWEGNLIFSKPFSYTFLLKVMYLMEATSPSQVSYPVLPKSGRRADLVGQSCQQIDSRQRSLWLDSAGMWLKPLN